MISVSWKEFQKTDGECRQYTHKHCTHSAVQSLHKRGTHRTRLAQELHNIFVRLKRTCHLVLHMSHPCWMTHLPFIISTSSSSFTLPEATTREHVLQSGHHDLLQEHPVHHQPLQDLPVDKLRHQESLWRENLQSGGGNPRTTFSTKCTGTHRYARVGANNASERMEQSEDDYVKLPAQWRNSWERTSRSWRGKRGRKQRMQRGYAGLFMRTTKTKGQVMRKMKWRNSYNTMSGHCSACGKGGIGGDNKRLDPELCAKARRQMVECIRRHKMYTRVPRETCLRETGKAPIKTGRAETDKGKPGKLTVRARWVVTHARPELRDDITVGRRRSAVEFLIKMISSKDDVKKQVLGEHAALEKSGRILNRVIEWGS